MLTQDEAELYDRQIRLWGVNAQGRIRQSKVLMLGFEGIASEVAKILVLAGIDTLTIVDNKELQNSDLTSNLFCRPQQQQQQQQQATNDKDHPDSQVHFRTHDVRNKLRKLNPLVKVNIDNSSILDKKPEEYKGYDLVTLHSFLTIDEIININNICNSAKIKFYTVLDYGFFGFMFNDLGPEFKFSYETFDDIGNDQSIKQSGEEKDPISLGDDDIAEESDGSSDEEEDRPKKKRRIHSPGREPVTKAKNEKQTKVGTLPYVNFQKMISAKTFICSHHTSPVLFVSITMLKFFSQYRHLPRSENTQVREEDIERLKVILSSLKDELNISESVFKKLDPNWFDYIYDSLSPVCAILGGVAGQDMIRALSNKDIPLNNTFSFDGISMNGIVEKVGVLEPEELKAKPVVRDLIQIDDDE